MDIDAHTCGTCKHGRLRDQCRECENAFEQAREQNLESLVRKVHAARGQFFDACGLPCIRPDTKS